MSTGLHPLTHKIYCVRKIQNLIWYVNLRICSLVSVNLGVCGMNWENINISILKSSVLVLQMDIFRQISTELWPLIDVINWFFTLHLRHFFTDFLQTLHEKV